MNNPTNKLDEWKQKYSPHYDQMTSWASSGSPTRADRIGMPLSVRAITNDGLADYWRLWDSLSAWVVPSLSPPNVVRGCITDSPKANAWPYRNATGSGEHVVVVTQGCIERMQYIAYLAANTAEKTPSLCKPETAIGALFPRVNLYTEDFEAFGEVVLQAAFVFLFFHEFAHVHNGHQGCASAEVHSEGEPSRSASTIEETAVLFQSREPNSELLSRTVEFDADASAYLWTDYFYGRFNANPAVLSQLGPVRSRMVSTALATPTSRQTIATLGAIVFNLALGSERHGADETHPNFKERVRLALLASQAIGRSKGFSEQLVIDCAQFGVAMVTLDSLSIEADRLLVGDGGLGEEPSNYRPLRDALLAYDEVEEGTVESHRHRVMAAVMKRLLPELKKNRIESSLPTADWWTVTP